MLLYAIPAHKELKQCKYIEKKVVRHTNDNFSDFSSDDDSDGEQIKAIRLMICNNVILREQFFKRAILKESNKE